MMEPTTDANPAAPDSLVPLETLDPPEPLDPPGASGLLRVGADPDPLGMLLDCTGTLFAQYSVTSSLCPQLCCPGVRVLHAARMEPPACCGMVVRQSTSSSTISTDVSGRYVTG